MSSLMAQETLQSAQLITEQLANNQHLYQNLAALFQKLAPQALYTLARGSSQNAIAYFNYLFALKTNRPACPLPHSLLTIHQLPLQLPGSWVVGISQSGMSPDIVRPFQYFQSQGVPTVALVNNPQSELALAAGQVVPLGAGAELSVAATKSFITSVVAAASLVASFAQDRQLPQQLASLPDLLLTQAPESWLMLVEQLQSMRHCLIVSRGLGLPFAQEMALKLKETCLIHAEAISSAELKHGPWSLIEKDFPVLLLATRDAHLPELLALAQQLSQLQARPLLIAPEGTAGASFTYPLAPHPQLDGIMAIQSFYFLAAALAEARGLDPDRPRNLKKITQTL